MHIHTGAFLWLLTSLSWLKVSPASTSVPPSLLGHFLTSQVDCPLSCSPPLFWLDVLILAARTLRLLKIQSSLCDFVTYPPSSINSSFCLTHIKLTFILGRHFAHRDVRSNQLKIFWQHNHILRRINVKNLEELICNLVSFSHTCEHITFYAEEWMKFCFNKAGLFIYYGNVKNFLFDFEKF